MENFSEDDFMVAWTSAGMKLDNAPEGKIAVGLWPDRTGWSDHYTSTTGCCDVGFQKLGTERKVQLLVNLFVELILGNGLDPEIVHREFRKIEIWRDMQIDLPNGSYVAYLPDGRWSPHNP